MALILSYGNTVLHRIFFLKGQSLTFYVSVCVFFLVFFFFTFRWLFNIKKIIECINLKRDSTKLLDLCTDKSIFKTDLEIHFIRSLVTGAFTLRVCVFV